MIRKLRLISKFRTSLTGKQIIAIHILPNISRSKGNQTMKFDQLVKYNVKNNFFFKNHTKNEAEILIADNLFFEKALYKVKACGQHVNFNIFIWPRTRTCDKSKMGEVSLLIQRYAQF